MNIVDVQKYLFGLIREKLPSNISLPEEIADVLNVSSDSAYRRIRADKQLTFDEVSILCKKFAISIDVVMGLDSGGVHFYAQDSLNDGFQIQAYLDALVNNLSAINTADDKLIYYIAKDLPLFYFFYFPKLAAFKYFFWLKTILCQEQYAHIAFEENGLEKLIEHYGKKILQAYNTIPSIEIWSTESIHSILKQIEYYFVSGLFNDKQTAFQLIDELVLLIEHIRQQADVGMKFHRAKPNELISEYKLFANEIVIGQNSVLVEANDMLTAFINYNTISFMSTRNNVFCQYTKENMLNTMKKSELMSGVGEKTRNIFFNSLMNHIYAVKNRLSV